MSEIAEKPTTIIRKHLARIIPYIDHSIPNMGLSKENMVVFDNVRQGEQLTCLMENGIKRHLTGLDEYAPEVLNILDPEKKAAVITSIRTKVIKLEQMLAANSQLKIDDEKFWEKVQIIRRDNHKLWDNIFIEMGNEPVFLDPETSEGLIRITAIEAGGFSLIAKSYEDARNSATPPKFYLDKEIETVTNKNEIKKIKNRALVALQKMMDKDPKRLMYVAKNIDNNSAQYRYNTSHETIYNNLDEFISGNSQEKSAKKAATLFLSVVEQPLEDLKVKAVIADANFYKFLEPRGDGMIYHRTTGSMIGRNFSDCVEYLKNTLNVKIWEKLLAEVEEQWKL